MRIVQIVLVLLVLVLYSCSSDDSGSGNMTDTIITPRGGVGAVSFEDDGNKVMEEYGMYGHLTAFITIQKANFAMWYNNGLGFVLDRTDVMGLSLQEVSDMSSTLIDLDQKIIQIVVMSPFKGQTKEGIKIGSSRTEVIAAYGEPDVVGSVTEDYEELKLSFWYYDSDLTVKRIDLLP